MSLLWRLEWGVDTTAPILSRKCNYHHGAQIITVQAGDHLRLLFCKESLCSYN